jgi:AAA family ATP:ADP antiporter
MRRFGLGMALAILPMTLVFASGGFLLAPTLVLGSFLSVADNGLHYSLNQSSKETLYVPTRVEEKYRAKAFIDMFGQRFAKAVAVGVSLVVTTVFSGPGDVRWLSLALLPLLVVWLLAARHAGRGFRSRESSVDRRLVAIDELRNRHAVARI